MDAALKPLRHGLTLLCVVAGTLLARPTAAQSDSAAVERMRAAFTINFARYTSWPAPARPTEPLRLCVAAGDPQFAAFVQANGLLVQGRPLRVQRVQRPEDAAPCDVLYVGTPAAAELLRGVAGQATLTVGDAPAFLSNGGIIRLFLGDQQMKFDVSLPQATRSNLVLAPQLLRLARAVDTGTP